MRVHKVLAAALFVAFPSMSIGPAFAEGYPERPVQIYVGTSAGGAVDTIARGLAQDMGQILGGTFIVVNRDGDNGTIAATQVVRSSPEGYALGFGAAGPFVSDPYRPEGVPYALDQVDFLCQLFEPAVALAVPRDSKIKSVPDFVAAAKREPGVLTVGTVGPGSVPNIAIALFEKEAGVEINKIPYKGDAENVTALLGGQIDAAVPGLTTVTGKGLPILGIFSSARAALYPEIPTMAELGYPVVKTGMVGLYAPKGLPESTRDRITNACREVAKSGPTLRSVAERLRQEVRYLDSAPWRARIIEDGHENQQVMQRLGIAR
jgi:tripartite-type tricarboxylate transporter receptor subunit TctC